MSSAAIVCHTKPHVHVILACMLTRIRCRVNIQQVFAGISCHNKCSAGDSPCKRLARVRTRLERPAVLLCFTREYQHMYITCIINCNHMYDVRVPRHRKLRLSETTSCPSPLSLSSLCVSGHLARSKSLSTPQPHPAVRAGR